LHVEVVACCGNFGGGSGPGYQRLSVGRSPRVHVRTFRDRNLDAKATKVRAVSHILIQGGAEPTDTFHI
jgi:hypothetical protein